MADFALTVVTPERTIYRGRVMNLIVRGSEGELGVLAHHMPLITALKPCVLRIVEAGGQHCHYAIGGGFLEVGRAATVILADSAEAPDEIDRGRAEAARQRAQSRLEKPGPDLDVARARAALERAQARLASLTDPFGH